MSPVSKSRIDTLVAEATIGFEGDPSLRAEVEAELRSHLESRLAEAGDEGLEDTAALEAAMGEFGEPGGIAAALVAANTPRLKIRAWVSLLLRRVLVPLSIMVALTLGFQQLRQVANISLVTAQVAGNVPFDIGSGGSRRQSLFQRLFARPIEERIADRIAAKDGPLVFSSIYGYEGEHSVEDLWRSDPANASYYTNYLVALLADEQNLPDDMVAHGREIDPGNAFYSILAAIAEMRRGLVVTGGAEPEVADPLAFGRAMLHLTEASVHPKYTRYRRDLLRERMGVLVPPRSLVDQLDCITVLAGVSLPEASEIQFLGKGLVAHSRRLVESEDHQGLRDLVSVWRKVALFLSKDLDFLVDAFIAQAFILQTGEALVDACDDLGLEHEAGEVSAVYGEVRDLQNRWKEERAEFSLSRGVVELKKHGSTLVSSALPLPVFADLPGRDELRPGRSLEYVVIERSAVTLGVLVLLVVMGVCGWASVAGRDHSVVLLLRVRDYGLILGGGVLVPLALYLIVTRATPLGGHQFSPSWGFPVWAAQLLAFFSMTVFLLVRLTSWRLQRPGLPSTAGQSQVPNRWKPWVPAAGILVLVLASGGLSVVSEKSVVAKIFLTISVLAAIVIMVSAVAWVAPFLWRRSPSTRRLGGALVPVFGTAIIALCAATQPLSHMRERHWVTSDTVLLSDDGAGFSSVEDSVTDRFRTELVAAFASRR